MSKREFAGYWEYVLDEAIFTSPPHPSWGGAACIAADGRVLGIGSLFVQEARGEGIASQGNMIVPIDLLKPILSDLMTLGRVDQPPRPWLGMYTSEADDTVFVAGVASGGPAERAGIKPGDFVLEVARRARQRPRRHLPRASGRSAPPAARSRSPSCATARCSASPSTPPTATTS